MTSSAVPSDLSLETHLKQVLVYAQELIPHQRGMVLVLRVNQDQLIPFLSEPTIDYSLDAINKNPSITEACRTKMPTFAHGEQCLGYTEMCAQLVIPIFSAQRFFGLIVLESNQPNAFAQKSHVLIELLSDYTTLGFSLQNARDNVVHPLAPFADNNGEQHLLNEISRLTTSDLPLREMMRQCAQQLTQLLHTDGCAITLWNEKEQRVERLAAYGDNMEEFTNQQRRSANTPSITAQLLKSGQPHIVNHITRDKPISPLIEEYPVRSMMAIPLTARGKHIGAVFLLNFFSNREFTLLDVERVNYTTDQLGLAIENHRLGEHIHQRLAETSALLKITSLTSSTLDLDTLLSRAIYELATMISADGAFLMMPDYPQQILVAHAASQFGICKDEKINIVPLINDTVIGTCFNDGEMQVLENFVQMPIILPNWHTMLLQPLISHDTILGVLVFIRSQAQREKFHQVHIELSRVVVSQIATSMENAQLYRSERQRADVMAVINRITQELSSTLELRELMDKALQLISENLAYESANLFLLQEKTATLKMVAHYSTIGRPQPEEWREFPITRGVAGRAVQTEKTQVVTTASNDPDFVIRPGFPLVTILLSIPLKTTQNVFGVLEVLTSRPEALHSSDKFILETLGTHLSILIENARLWQQSEQRLNEQTMVHQISYEISRVLDYQELVVLITRHMRRALNTNVCRFIAADGDTGQLTVEAEHYVDEDDHSAPLFYHLLTSYERELIVRSIRTRKLVQTYIDPRSFSHDAAATRPPQTGLYALLIIPMVANDRAIGCMMWVETRHVVEFSESELRLAQTLVMQAGTAVENARLFWQAQRQAHEQALLRRVALELRMQTDIPTMLQMLVREVCQALTVNNVLLVMYSNIEGYKSSAQTFNTLSCDQMVLSYIVGKDTLPPQLAPLASGNALQTGTDLLIKDLNPDLAIYPHNTLLMPILRRHSELLGIIEISSDNPNQRYNTHEIQLLEALATQCAIAYDNISLRQREKRRLDQMVRLQDTNRAITVQLQKSILLQTIVNEARHIFEVPAISLMLKVTEDEPYSVAAVSGLSRQYRRERQMLFQDLQQPTFREAQTELLEYQRQLLAEEKIYAMLTVPMMRGLQQIGLINLYTRTPQQVFAEDEKELAQLFGSQAAIAIENATLFETLEDRAVELAHANQLRSEFLAKVSHELRTPMNSINGYSDLLLSGTYGSLTEKQKDRLERISRNGRDLLALINDLLDLSRIDLGRLELELTTVDLAKLIDLVVTDIENQAQERNLYVHWHRPAFDTSVKADQRRVRQILVNILSNALKFTREGGMTIRQEAVQWEGNPFILTHITDTGIGISAENQEIIFDEFRQADGSSTREYSGTGLGLAISRRLVEMMGGAIWVESQLGTGTTFTFALPCEANVLAPSNQTA